MSKIGIIVGSLRKESYNRKLANSVKNILEKDFQVEVSILEIGNLPLFNADLENDFPEVVTRLKKEIDSVDKIVFCTPEYNRSMPGVLKNAIDWASRPDGKNSLTKKHVLTMGVSSGRLGTVSAQNELKKVLNYLNCYVVGQPEIYIGPAKDMYDETKNDFNDKTLEVVKKGLTELVNR